jgi:anthranilate phosphoribosyltransferase
VDAAALGLSAAPASALAGGDPATNARILRSVLGGGKGPRRDAVVLNAAAAIWIAGAAPTLPEAGLLAAERIASGAALRLLDTYVALSHRVGEE